jgi:hypothetical protein
VGFVAGAVASLEDAVLSAGELWDVVVEDLAVERVQRGGTLDTEAHEGPFVVLRHVDIEGHSAAEAAIAAGAGYEYTYDTPYQGQVGYQAAEDMAEEAGAGRWGACTKGGCEPPFWRSTPLDACIEQRLNQQRRVPLKGPVD